MLFEISINWIEQCPNSLLVLRILGDYCELSNMCTGKVVMKMLGIVTWNSNLWKFYEYKNEWEDYQLFYAYLTFKKYFCTSLKCFQMLKIDLINFLAYIERPLKF